MPLTRLSAPARELNRVAVTTRRLSGSTAPTATSGVTTMLTSFGGAVKIVARPKRTGNDTGVEPRGDAGIPGVLARGLQGLIPLTLRRAFDIGPWLVAKGLVGELLELLRMDWRRALDTADEVERPSADDVERLSVESVRGRSALGGGDRDAGEVEVPGALCSAACFSSPSCHCKCMMIDLVAHCRGVS